MHSSTIKVTLTKFFTVGIISLFLVGCTVYTKRSGGSYQPSASNNYEGLLVVEFSLDGYDAAEIHMIRECEPFGGFKRGSAHKTSAPPPYDKWGWNFGNTYWKYSCNGLKIATQKSSTPRFDCETKLGSKASRNLVDQCVDAHSKNIPFLYPTIENTPKSNLSFDSYKTKCTDLGFKPGTQEFGKCVLQLSK